MKIIVQSSWPSHSTESELGPMSVPITCKIQSSRTGDSLCRALIGNAARWQNIPCTYLCHLSILHNAEGHALQTFCLLSWLQQGSVFSKGR